MSEDRFFSQAAIMFVLVSPLIALSLQIAIQGRNPRSAIRLATGSLASASLISIGLLLATGGAQLLWEIPWLHVPSRLGAGNSIQLSLLIRLNGFVAAMMALVTGAGALGFVYSVPGRSPVLHLLTFGLVALLISGSLWMIAGSALTIVAASLLLLATTQRVDLRASSRYGIPRFLTAIASACNSFDVHVVEWVAGLLGRAIFLAARVMNSIENRAVEGMFRGVALGVLSGSLRLRRAQTGRISESLLLALISMISLIILWRFVLAPEEVS